MKRKRKNQDEPKAIGDILSDLRKDSELAKKFNQARIWENWPDIAGKHLCTHGRPRTVKDATLHIEADSAVWMHKFAYRKWDIIGRINRLVGHELVSDVFVVLADDEMPPPPDPHSQHNV
ncbi:MAG: DUF721 domain-containing protein [bacterium]|nr:DUF721 domain-containing protein [bacterium]